MAIKIRLPFFNYPNFFQFFFLALVVTFRSPNYNRVWIGWPKILVVEMAIEIMSPLFNSLDFLLIFFMRLQKIMAIEMTTKIMSLIFYGPPYFFHINNQI